MKFSVVVAEAWRSLTASLSTTLAAALTVLIGMFLVGLLIAFWHLRATPGATSRRGSSSSRSTCAPRMRAPGDEATPAQINAVNQQLLADSRVKKVRFVSKEEGLAQMRKDQPELVKVIPVEPLARFLYGHPERVSTRRRSRRASILLRLEWRRQPTPRRRPAASSKRPA